MKSLVLIMVVVLLSGCMGSSSKPVRVSASDMAEHINLSPEDILSDAIKRQNDGAASKLDYYAPDTFAEAEKQLKSVQDAVTKQLPKKELVQLNIAHKKSIQKAFDIKDRVSELLSEHFHVKALLIKLNTQEVLAKQYQDLDGDLADLVADYEEGDYDEKEGQKLLSKMEALEIAATKLKVLGPTDRLLRKLKETDLDELAPSSYQIAMDRYNRGLEQITQTPRDQEVLSQVQSEASYLAHRAQWVSVEVRELTEKDPEQYEAVILTKEKLLTHIAQSNSIELSQDVSTEAQSRALSQIISSQFQPIVAKPSLAESSDDSQSLVSSDTSTESTENEADKNLQETIEDESQVIDSMAIEEELPEEAESAPLPEVKEADSEVEAIEDTDVGTQSEVIEEADTSQLSSQEKAEEAILEMEQEIKQVEAIEEESEIEPADVELTVSDNDVDVSEQ